MYLRAHYVLHNVPHFTCSSASQYTVFTQNSTFRLTMCIATVNCYSPPTLDSITPDKQAVMHDLLFIDTDRLLVCARHVHWTTSTETHNLSSRRLHFGSLLPDPLSGLVLPRPTGQPLNDGHLSFSLVLNSVGSDWPLHATRARIRMYRSVELATSCACARLRSRLVSSPD